MSGIPEELIEQVRDAADIVEIIGESVTLKRTGSDYRGPCPFHSGKNRNLAVIPKKQIYYCFVCHEGGDVFTFFMKQMGMDYFQRIGLNRAIQHNNLCNLVYNMDRYAFLKR